MELDIDAYNAILPDRKPRVAPSASRPGRAHSHTVAVALHARSRVAKAEAWKQMAWNTSARRPAPGRPPLTPAGNGSLRPPLTDAIRPQ
jgi:hypothetical protein